MQDMEPMAIPFATYNYDVRGILQYLRSVSHYDSDGADRWHRLRYLASAITQSSKHEDGRGIDALEQIIEDDEAENYLSDILDDSSDQDDAQEYIDEHSREMRLSALFSLCHVFLSRGRHQDAWAVLEETDEFDSSANFIALRAFVRSRFGTEQDYQRAIECAYQAKRIDGSNLEVLNIFSEIVGDMIERGFEYTGDDPSVPHESESLLQSAREAMASVIGADSDCPEYQLTYARILALAGEYADARNHVSKAVGMVERGRVDFTRIITEYSMYSQKIDLIEQRIQFQQNIRKQEEEVTSDIQETLEETTEEYRTRILQYLVFFGGVIAIAVTSASIGSTATSAEDGILIALGLTGGLLVAFGGLSLVLPNHQGWGLTIRRTLIFILGVGLVVLVMQGTELALF